MKFGKFLKNLFFGKLWIKLISAVLALFVVVLLGIVA